MVKNARENNNELFFVEIREPSEVRKHILETLKDVLELLQKFESFKHLRHDKMVRIDKLRVLMRDANKLMGVLKTKLPQTSLKGMVPKQHAPKKVQAKKKEMPEKVPKKERTELDKLQFELNAIESKLKSFT